MKLKKLLLMALGAQAGMAAYAQNAVARFDMSLRNGSIVESIANNAYTVHSELPACNGTGLDGEALRFDGYSNYVRAAVPVSSLSSETLTLNVCLAAESYPMMQVDVAEATPTYATICGNLDETNKKGFALQLSSQGDLRLQVAVAYGNGYLIVVDGNKKLERGRWNNVTMTFDKAGNAVTLCLNGEAIGTKRVNKCALLHGDTDFYIGKDASDKKFGPFLINTFCGLIDDIILYNELLDNSHWAMADEQRPDFNYPDERYAENLWRPQFHAMPSGSWTNESHGMTFSDGRWHVFFQKNANGPYMSRLHWGHISSDNLYDWRDESIAIAPGESYDLKGCWSGCIYDDGGTPTILYTAVDNAKATIAQAKATDSSLQDWEKQGIVINGKPAGLTDDFRDPYFFTANGEKYIIVGTSKNGIGACTLHKYQGGTWTNDGTIFFQGGSATQHGTFWEMPNLTNMGNGKWLFTCTPLNTASGVRTLCWVGTIGTDGKFSPDGNGMQYLEMGGISRDGFGLLSPTICQKDGKTLLLGIVPDKLPTEQNFRMGWAHNFSLPRELSLDDNGQILQKPYGGLTAMRSSTSFAQEQTLMGVQSLSPVSGRQIEMMGEFTVGNSGQCGFRFLKNGNKQVTLSYDVATGMLTLNMVSIDRVSTDNGVWSAALPQKIANGEKLKLHVFFDGSIADIFVCDRWAFSTRIFPTDEDAVNAEVYTTSSMPVKVNAWKLTKEGDTATSIRPTVPYDAVSQHPNTPIYDLQGRCISDLAPQGKGIIIQNGRKVICNKH